jgi:predicted nucleic acid-binding Zn ribbon protein
MPIFEHICYRLDCSRNSVVVEGYFRRSDPMPTCPGCGNEMSRLVSGFAVTFAGPITARYNDKKLEYAHQEGHWLWCKKGPGGPRREWVDTWQRRKELMKQEGLEDAGPLEGSSDGRKASGVGMPGCW